MPVDNSIRCHLAMGGSTNAMIHVVAMARRAGVPLTLDRFDELARQIPVIANVRPSGKYLMEDFYYADEVPAADEIRRVVPVIEALAGRLGARVSIDTVKPEVATAALAAGASVVNDVRCSEDPALAKAAAAKGADYVIMRNRGRGEVRSPNTDYADIVEDVLTELLAAAERVERAGVPRASVWLDPGLGFAKTAAQSAVLLSSLGRFQRPDTVY